jgi:hypothetical protein
MIVKCMSLAQVRPPSRLSEFDAHAARTEPRTNANIATLALVQQVQHGTFSSGMKLLPNDTILKIVVCDSREYGSYSRGSITSSSKSS